MLWREDHEHTTPCLGIICAGFFTLSLPLWWTVEHGVRAQLPGVELCFFGHGARGRSSAGPSCGPVGMLGFFGRAGRGAPDPEHGAHSAQRLCESGGEGVRGLLYGCIVHLRMRPHDPLSHVLCYLKRNLPDLGNRAGRGHIVLRLKGLGRTELPVWVRLLHGCLRGVDILRHGRARRSVSGATRSGYTPQAGVRATWRTWRLVACLSVPSASLKRRASCTTTRTHARLRSHSQHASGRGGEGGREGARGGRGARGGGRDAEAPARCPCAASHAAPAAPLAAARPAPVARRQTRVRGGAQ